MAFTVLDIGVGRMCEADELRGSLEMVFEKV